MLAPEVIDQAEQRVGQTLCGKWHLDRVIGVGGMASVYEATHRNLNRVAIKLLHPALSLDEGTRYRFLREGYVANTIRHPGAVQVLDDDTTEDGSAFLVMELLEGESVEQRAIRKGGVLEAKEAVEIIEQLLDVLAAAHDQDIIHRDIKPDNLFLTEDKELKVLDFGIARLHQGDTRSTRAGSFMGTPAFSAPEQARGRWNRVDARTDLYAVGATLFTLLTGSHVHEAETPSEQLALAISAPARSLAVVMPEAPKELVELVDTALSYNKEERFQSARAFKAAVQRVAAGLPEKMTLRPPIRSSIPAETLPLPRRQWAWGAPWVRLLMGIALAVGLAFVLLALGEDAGRDTRRKADREQDASSPASPSAAGPDSPEARGSLSGPGPAQDGEDHVEGRESKQALESRETVDEESKAPGRPAPERRSSSIADSESESTNIDRSQERLQRSTETSRGPDAEPTSRSPAERSAAVTTKKTTAKRNPDSVVEEKNPDSKTEPETPADQEAVAPRDGEKVPDDSATADFDLPAQPEPEPDEDLFDKRY